MGRHAAQRRAVSQTRDCSEGARRLGSLNKVLRLIVIGLLLFQLTPIGGELAEAMTEIVAHGDESHDDAPDAEHGCTTLMHHCSCHSVAGTIREISIETAPARLVAPSEFVLTRPRVAPDAHALLRPPAA